VDQLACEDLDGCFFDTDAGCSSTDLSPPVYQNCPLNFDVVTLQDENHREVSWVPIGALDNGESVPVLQTSEYGSDSTFPIGTSTVQYMAVDLAGNTEMCTFTVTVTDPWPPVFTYCPDEW
jgi:hypothetical protein